MILNDHGRKMAVVETYPVSIVGFPSLKSSGHVFAANPATEGRKTHSYWSVVENQRLEGSRVVQRHVLYLGEISPTQAAAWRKFIEVFDEDAGRPRTLSLFPEDRATAVASDSSNVQLRLTMSCARHCRRARTGPAAASIRAG